MKISLLTLGTRGDVQPYAVLGRALKQCGHEVILSTGKNFESLAREYGVDFVPVEADFQALINSEEGRAMMKNPFLAKKHFKGAVQPMMIGALKIFYEVAKGSDCVLFHVKSLGDFFADQFPEKMMRANVVPAIEPTSQFPNPVFSALSLAKFLNRFTYKLADLGLSMMSGTIKQFRADAGLPPSFPKNLKLPSIYGISPHFLPMPTDYASESYYTGFWYGSSIQPLENEVNDFINPNKSTILMTFGSMPFETKFDLQKALLELSKELTVKVLVVKGWGFENTMAFSESEEIKVIQHAPYDRLFPMLKAVVHHGGIGTMAECLRAGVPFLSCPVIYPMGDQYFWAKQAYDLGCSVRPVPLKKMTPKILTKSVGELLASETLAANAARTSNALKGENGIGNAIQIIERHFESGKTRKPFAPDS